MGNHLILVNPWIDDFAAYDLWAKPLGLLTLAGVLRGNGYPVHLIDCLDVHHPSIQNNPSGPPAKRRLHGTGKYPRREIPRPEVLSGVPRPYSRYGFSEATLREDLAAVSAPAAILVTSLMTYWYPGVQAAIAAAREVHPRTPVILGGIYARLCTLHARQRSGADHVFVQDDPASLMAMLKGLGSTPMSATKAEAPHPYPAFDLLHGLDYVCLLASRGCPYACRYCASHFLNPSYTRRSPEDVLGEVRFWRGKGVQDFAFYDDALLVKPHEPLHRLLNGLAEVPGVRFHTPNALHVREITPRMAVLLKRAGFKTVRLGLETADFSRGRPDEKVKEGDFEKAVSCLMGAGFKGTDIGAYLLAGLPGQSIESVHETLSLVEKTGVMPHLSEYSPIPRTALWSRAVAASSWDIAAEPLYHNNTLLPCWSPRERDRVPELRGRLKAIREKVRALCLGPSEKNSQEAWEECPDTRPAKPREVTNMNKHT